MIDIPSDEWIGTKEAGEVIGVTRRFVTKLINNGKIEGKLILGRWMVRKKDILSYKEKMDSLGNQKHGIRSSE